MKERDEHFPPLLHALFLCIHLLLQDDYVHVLRHRGYDRVQRGLKNIFVILFIKMALLIEKRDCYMHLSQKGQKQPLKELQASSFIKKRLWHKCFPVKFPKYLGTPFLQNTSGRLLLKCQV